MSTPVVPVPPAGRRRGHALPEMWTGITGPDCHLCSWSWRNGRREIKLRNAMCPVHYRAGDETPGDTP